MDSRLHSRHQLVERGGHGKDDWVGKAAHVVARSMVR